MSLPRHHVARCERSLTGDTQARGAIYIRRACSRLLTLVIELRIYNTPCYRITLPTPTLRALAESIWKGC